MRKGEKRPDLQRARIANCPVCEKEFRAVNDHHKRKQKYCSKECWKNRRKLNDCEYCGNKITSYHGKKYCSRECSHSAMVGSKAPTWKDGKSLERDRARLGTEIKEWRKAVFKRDNYTCQHCKSETYLQAHHIIEWAKDESKRFDVENGITLCIDCHGKVHGKNFTHRAKKKCICGKQIKRESNFCRSCAVKNQWERARAEA